MATQIVVTEIPYQTSVEAIEAKAAELVNNHEIDGIRAIRNGSAKGKVELVFELKKDAPALVILNNLYKHTPMQTTFATNFVALVDGVPRTLGLKEALDHYVRHQREVIRRRSEYRLGKARARAHIVEGLLRAIDLIDEIIAAIRASDDKPAARVALRAEPFEFSEEQAEHILDMPLSRLTRLGRSTLEEELAEPEGHDLRPRGDPGRRRDLRDGHHRPRSARSVTSSPFLAGRRSRSTPAISTSRI